jgi:hypothetical protein
MLGPAMGLLPRYGPGGHGPYDATNSAMPVRSALSRGRLKRVAAPGDGTRPRTGDTACPLGGGRRIDPPGSIRERRGISRDRGPAYNRARAWGQRVRDAGSVAPFLRRGASRCSDAARAVRRARHRRRPHRPGRGSTSFDRQRSDRDRVGVRISRIDPSSGKGVETMDTASGPQLMLAMDDALWVTATAEPAVQQIDPRVQRDRLDGPGRRHHARRHRGARRRRVGRLRVRPRAPSDRSGDRRGRRTVCRLGPGIDQCEPAAPRPPGPSGCRCSTAPRSCRSRPEPCRSQGRACR